MARSRSNPQATSGSWRDRGAGHGDVAPGDLAANPRNWRIHPKAQQDAMGDVLAEVGWVAEVIVNKRTGFVLDGHMRVAMAITHNEPTVPVKYVDLSEEEEILVLVTFDPVGDMAERANDALEELVGDVAPVGEAARAMLEDLLPADGEKQPRKIGTAIVSYQIIFDDEDQQGRWFAFLRELKVRYQGETIAERLDAFLEGHEWSD